MIATSMTHQHLWMLHDYGQYFLQRVPIKDHKREIGEPITYIPEINEYNMHTEYFIFWYLV